MIQQRLEQRLVDALASNGSASSDFDLNADIALPAGRRLTNAAVLVGIDTKSQSVLLTKRSPRLRHHPGQIAFPGGKQDQTDVDLAAAALREAKEEVGLPDGAVKILGSLPSHETVTGFQVTPFVALVEDFKKVAEAGEVAEIFNVPLEHVRQTKNYRIEARVWQGKSRKYYVVPYGPYYIWGATARILYGLATRFQ